MEIVFSMPGIPQEKVLEYSLVPTYLKSQAELVQQQCLEEDDDEDDPSAGAKNNALRATITPAIFVLTARYGEDEDSDATLKHLKIVRCPAVDMANWAFEVGTTPEPRLASEVLPGASNVTVSISSIMAGVQVVVGCYLSRVCWLYCSASAASPRRRACYPWPAC